jgi:nucleotidyltransferase substrate binding protein (TIGR01987 family)
MERLELKYRDAEKALNTLKEILNEPFSVIVRDASIQRFEYTFEAFWKFIKGYLKEKEGVVANSPKACFREIFSLGFSSEKETVQLQDMTDKRNDTSHTYKEEVAQSIYNNIKNYCLLMEKVLDKFKVGIQPDAA